MKIADILARPQSPSRTAALVHWLQSLYPQDVPVLVGGAAVELLTRGAYVSGDLDFVGFCPPEVEEKLLEAGFYRQGRHWRHRPSDTFIEFPGSSLDQGEQAIRVRIEGREVLVLSPEDLLVDRLAHWEFWQSTIDGVNALRILYLWSEQIDRNRMKTNAAQREVLNGLRAIEQAFARFGATFPSTEVVDQWIKSDPLNGE